MADPRSLDDSVEALEALRALASLPERRRIDLALKVAGYSYEEIRAQTPGRTRSNVNKSLRESPGAHPADATAPEPVIASASRASERKGGQSDARPSVDQMTSSAARSESPT